MKKFIIVLGLLELLLMLPSVAQNWRTNGNTVTTADKLGSLNLQDLKIITNNQQRAVFKAVGNIGLDVAGDVNATGFRINGVPLSSGIDSISIVNRKLLSWKNGLSTIKGYIVPLDDDNNLIQGINSTVTNGLNNNIIGDGVSIINGSGNIAQANHAQISYSNNGAFFGADHTASADYGFIANDANNNRGASGSCFGFGNWNWDENGWVGGSECVNGTPNIPNGDYSTFCYGYRSWNRGDCSQTQGTYLKNLSDYSMVWGFGVHASNIYAINTTDDILGFVNNSDRLSVIIHKATGAGTYSIFESKGSIKNMPPEYPDNATAYAALGDSIFYKTSVGDEWFVKVTHAPSQFQLAQLQDNINHSLFKRAAEADFLSVTYEQAIQLKGKWYNMSGQSVHSLNIGIYILIDNGIYKKVLIK